LFRGFAVAGCEPDVKSNRAVVLGMLVGIAGVGGALGVGFLTDRLGKRDRRYYCWMPAIVACVAMVSNIAVYSSGSVTTTFALLIIPLIALPASGGPLYAAV